MTKTVEQIDTQVKNWFQSKTIWGIVIALLPVLSNLAGFDIGESIGDTYTEVISIVGSVLAIYGRWKANGQIVATKVKKK